ncbi:MAG: Gfo/Idh/MocA family oxidoreductase [Candidatus Marinimicrobia bacterium]|nr:Gfo/Idh/MocA family oxidoreductase [Candidatus Neomarinimicrobiota bacterium]
MIERALIVGLGSIGKRHVRIVRELFPKINITVLRHNQCDENNMGVDSCVTTIEDAIARKPQVAIIANPATMHLEVAMQLAKNNIHLLIEKPIAISSQGVQELINLCEQKQLVLMTAYNLRFMPSLMELQKQLQKNKIGRIFSIKSEVGQNLPSWRPDQDYRKSVSAQKKLGGGVLSELSHEIDYISWIFGPIEWVKSHISKVSNLEVDVEDNANIILGFGGKLDKEFSATLNMDFIRQDITRMCTVIGELGTLRWNGVLGTLHLYTEETHKWKLLFSSLTERDYTYKEEFKHFISSIESKKTTLISGTDGLNVILAIEAIHRSNSTGKIAYI